MREVTDFYFSSYNKLLF